MDKPFEPAFSFSERAQQLTSSAIREILKVTERPEVISFAGGLPAPGGFPVEVVRAAFDKVLSTNGRRAAVRPDRRLRAAAQVGRRRPDPRRRRRVARPGPDRVRLAAGARPAGQVLIDKDSKILVEDPSYLGALQSFSLYQPKYVPVPTDDGGLIPEAITPELASGARFLYALPNFQNPTGRTLNLERRIALVKRAAELNLTIIEDDPYGELRYAGEPQPGLLTLAAEYGANVIRLGTFSKVLAPACAWASSPRAPHHQQAGASQAGDRPAHAHADADGRVRDRQDGFLEEHLPNVREIYRAQGSCMLDAIQKEFPASVSWTKPEGGMFIWVTLPEHMDSAKLLEKAIAQNVAFVPGAPFYSSGGRANTLRLSFATVPEDKIRTGIAILGKILKEG